MRRLIAAVVPLTLLLAWRRRTAGRAPSTALPAADAEASGYWRRYLTSEDGVEAAATIETVRLPWQDIELRVDVYTAQPDAPTVVFTHGIGFYTRAYAALLLQLRRRGLNVVAVDLAGMGYSGGARAAYTVFDHVTNVCAATDYACDRFRGPLVSFGISLGGILAYYAAATDDRLSGAVAYNLLDFSDNAMVRKVLRVGWAMPVLAPVVEWTAAWAPWLHLPWSLILDPRQVLEDPHWRRVVENDPLILKSYSLNLLQSMVATPPDTPFEWFKAPVLVIAPERDRLFTLPVIREAYERLGGPKELWVIPDAPHVTFDRQFLVMVGDKVADWVHALEAARAPRP